MHCYDLRFSDDGKLRGAYAKLAEKSRISSAILEPAARRLRFIAEQEHGDPLVQRIYLEGGLTWCSRYREV